MFASNVICVEVIALITPTTASALSYTVSPIANLVVALTVSTAIVVPALAFFAPLINTPVDSTAKLYCLPASSKSLLASISNASNRCLPMFGIVSPNLDSVLNTTF